jgi:hypothetical protein
LLNVCHFLPFPGSSSKNATTVSPTNVAEINLKFTLNLSLNFRQLTEQLLHPIISFCHREKIDSRSLLVRASQRHSSAKQSTANQSGNDDNLMHVVTKMDLN